MKSTTSVLIYLIYYSLLYQTLPSLDVSVFMTIVVIFGAVFASRKPLNLYHTPFLHTIYRFPAMPFKRQLFWTNLISILKNYLVHTKRMLFKKVRWRMWLLHFSHFAFFFMFVNVTFSYFTIKLLHPQFLRITFFQGELMTSH